MCSSKWDGVYEPVTEAKTPVYFVIGESDEYYGSEPFKEAYQILYELYAEQGLAKSEIDNLLVLDIKELLCRNESDLSARRRLSVLSG